MIRDFLSFAAYLGLPAVFIYLCIRMRIKKIPRPPEFQFLLILGTPGGLLWLWISDALWAGGLLFAMLFYGASLCATMASSIYLSYRPEQTFYHRLAIWGGWAFVVGSLLLLTLIPILKEFL